MSSLQIRSAPGICPDCLQPISHKRTLEHVHKTLRAGEILQLILGTLPGHKWLPWPYQYPSPWFEARDRSLPAMIFLTQGRISEVISVRFRQFDLKDPDFLIIRDMAIVKRRFNPKSGQPVFRGIPVRDEVPLPRKGEAAGLTQLVQDYLDYGHDQEGLLYDFGRRRALQLITHTTGYWDHFFRAQGERWAGRIYQGNPVNAAKHVGVKNAASMEPYMPSPWRDNRERFQVG